MKLSRQNLMCAIVAAYLMPAPFAGAAILPMGMYDLANHPDGGIAAPYYGLRLDELYDATGSHDRFTFDFDHNDSNMQMEITATSIRIFGTSFGGRDIGSEYAADSYLGVYSIDFTYDIGVGMAPGDDDMLVDGPNNANTGTIMTPLGDTIALEDERGNHGYSFRLGDKDDDNGHRGFDGISGWGWLNHSDEPHVYASDWLFTAVPSQVPTPAAATALLAGLGLTSRRRTR